MENELSTDRMKKSRLSSVVAVFRLIGLPLLQAMAEAQGAVQKNNEDNKVFDEETFSLLIDRAISLSREFGASLDEAEGNIGSPEKWLLAGTASQIIASSYKASKKIISQDSIKQLASLAKQLQQKVSIIGFESPKADHKTSVEIRYRIVEAMIPVIGAISQYSFGRAEHGLLAEIAEQLIKVSKQITRSIAPPGISAEEWLIFYWNILRASGYIYADSHYAEADRIFYMNPEERTELFSKNDGIVPMNQVWQAFRQRMAMLATLAMYIDVPEDEELKRQAWI